MITTALESTGTAYLTRADILKFPFPYKVWLVVHLEFCDFLRWNRDGTVILLDLVALEIYLNSTRSIFNIKNRSSFLQHLEQFQFERLNALPEAEEDLVLQYKHEHFQRHRLDLLAKIRRPTYQVLDNARGEETNKCNETAHENTVAAKMLSHRINERMLGDLCFMSHGGISNIQKQRIRLQTILNFQNETRILQAKLQAADEHAAAQHVQQRRNASMKSELLSRAGMPPPPPPPPVEEEQVIELPVELFENPHDSVLHLGDDFRPEYAGYYGNCNKEQILHFFGDYLPMYEDGTMEVKKIIADFSIPTPNSNAINATSCIESLPESMQTDNSNNFNMQTTSTPLPAKSMPSLNLSSTLQPIFKTDEEEVAEQTANDMEADISMDEFIKFKKNVLKADEFSEVKRADTELFMETQNNDNPPNGTTAPPPTSAVSDFPQMPTAIKMELTEDVDSENEANFRNFFSQYRASLNLLYERH